MTGFHPLILPDCHGSSYYEANAYVSPYTIGWSFTVVICPRGEAISSHVGKIPTYSQCLAWGGGGGWGWGGVGGWVDQYIDGCIIFVDFLIRKYLINVIYQVESTKLIYTNKRLHISHCRVEKVSCND